MKREARVTERRGGEDRLRALVAAVFAAAVLAGCVYEKGEAGARPEREVRRDARPDTGRDSERPPPPSASQPTRIHPKD